MGYNFRDEVKLFMIFDILGDTVRSGPMMWCVNRERLEDVKNHILDLILIFRLIKRYFPISIDENKVEEYFIIHDLPEAITGDITKFEGISQEERKRVNDIAINYLIDRFEGIFNFKHLFYNFENQVDIESKIAHMIDAVHSATTFMKYQNEGLIDPDNQNIIPELRNLDLVNQGLNNGKDVADIFYEYHSKAIRITAEECIKYGISRESANEFTEVIKSFIDEMYYQKQEGRLIHAAEDFPSSAKKYKNRLLTRTDN